MLLATMLIPEDAYPNTTFEHGSLQLITEEAWSRRACRQAQAVGEGQSRRLKALKMQEISFEGQENQSTTGGATVLERAYTGFAEGTCYEFLLIVASGDTAEESVKAADTVSIMKSLEKITASLKLFPRTKEPTIAASTETSGRL